ncbi:MAG: anti-sigma factor RsbA family regulatory protein [Actinomycetota bacterium]
MPTGPFRHGVFFYDSPQAYVDGILPFLKDGLESGAPLLVMVPAPNVELLRDGLGPEGSAVCFADMAEVGRNPARIIPAWHDFLAEHAGNGPLRGVGEPIWPGRSPAELVECQSHEALLNLAFASAGAFDLLCPYDAAGLGTEVLEEALRTHPYRFAQGRAEMTDSWVIGRDSVSPFRAELPDPPGTRTQLPFGSLELRDVRGFVGERLAAAGMARGKADDCLLAVHEVATNSLRHGGGGGLLSAWTEPDRLVFFLNAALLARPTFPT